jgi:hypothetical protein
VQRVVNSVVLRDADGWFARLRERVSAEYAAPVAVAARFRALAARADALRAEAREALAAGDTSLAVLQIRLAVQAAAGSEPAAADMLAEFDQLRLDAATHYARGARETGRLRVSETECRDVLAATMDATLWQRLVAEGGWPDDRFAAWLGELWVSMLVGPAR